MILQPRRLATGQIQPRAAVVVILVQSFPLGTRPLPRRARGCASDRGSRTRVGHLAEPDGRLAIRSRLSTHKVQTARVARIRSVAMRGQSQIVVWSILTSGPFLGPNARLDARWLPLRMGRGPRTARSWWCLLVEAQRGLTERCRADIGASPRLARARRCALADNKIDRVGSACFAGLSQS